jgi:hypothetical protein
MWVKAGTQYICTSSTDTIHDTQQGCYKTGSKGDWILDAVDLFTALVCICIHINLQNIHIYIIHSRLANDGGALACCMART